MIVSIPLKSGHIVISLNNLSQNGDCVSIPLKSGHIVIQGMVHFGNAKDGFNPLKIGAYCNYGTTKVNRSSMEFQSP